MGAKARHDEFQSATPALQRYTQAFWMLGRFDHSVYYSCSMSTQLSTVSLLIQIKRCQLAVQPSASSCLDEATFCPLHLWDLHPARTKDLAGQGFSQVSFLRLLFKGKKDTVPALEKARFQQVILLCKAVSHRFRN